jgi:hypothetical protein
MPMDQSTATIKDEIVTNLKNRNEDKEVVSTPPSEDSDEILNPIDAWVEKVDKLLKDTPPEHIPDPPVAVLPWLYLSPIFCVRDSAAKLKDLGVTHVISTNRMAPQAVETLYWELRSYDIDHLYIEADDLLSYDMIGRHWDECREFLEQVPKSREGKALIHCNAGQNRSGVSWILSMLYCFEIYLGFRDKQLLIVFTFCFDCDRCDRGSCDDAFRETRHSPGHANTESKARIRLKQFFICSAACRTSC